MKFRNLAAIATAATALLSSPASAAEVEVTIQNLTRGIYFTPLLVTTHPAGTSLFSSGQPASTGIQAMAEGGDTSGLQDLLSQLSCDFDANPAGGLLAPGHSASTTLRGGAGTNNALLSVVGMILPSNDGFVGLNSIHLPTEPGTYTYDVSTYDAGTEANNELRGSGMPGEAGMPVPPPLDPLLGTSGTGVTTSAEGFIHIHRGNLGDTNPTGGISDIDSQRHRWLTPAARVVVTIK